MRLVSPVVLFHRLHSFFQRGRLKIGARAKISPGASISFRRGDILIGRKVRIHSGVILDAQRGMIQLGDNVSINPFSILYGSGGIKIGDNVRIAAHSVIVSFDHNYKDKSKPITLQGITRKPIIIEDDVWIGAGAKILGGSHIERGCVIAANAVVKGRTECFGVYAGSPARKIAERE